MFFFKKKEQNNADSEVTFSQWEKTDCVNLSECHLSFGDFLDEFVLKLHVLPLISLESIQGSFSSKENLGGDTCPILVDFAKILSIIHRNNSKAAFRPMVMCFRSS